MYAIFHTLAPSIIIQSNLVGCQLTACMTLKPGTSINHAYVRLPDRFPAVTVAYLDSCTPSPILHLTNVSHPVCPSRARPGYATSPMLALVYRHRRRRCPRSVLPLHHILHWSSYVDCSSERAGLFSEIDLITDSNLSASSGLSACQI